MKSYMSRVTLLDSDLINKHEYSLHGQLSATEVKEIFKRWSKQVHYKHIILLLDTKPPAVGITYYNIKCSSINQKKLVIND